MSGRRPGIPTRRVDGPRATRAPDGQHLLGVTTGGSPRQTPRFGRWHLRQGANIVGSIVEVTTPPLPPFSYGRMELRLPPTVGSGGTALRGPAPPDRTVVPLVVAGVEAVVHCRVERQEHAEGCGSVAVLAAAAAADTTAASGPASNRTGSRTGAPEAAARHKGRGGRDVLRVAVAGVEGPDRVHMSRLNRTVASRSGWWLAWVRKIETFG